MFYNGKVGNPAGDLFGGEMKGKVLVAVYLLEEATASELARAFSAHLVQVQRACNSWQKAGVFVSRISGRNRLFSVNHRYSARPELFALLQKLAAHDLPLQKQLATLRRRPGLGDIG